MRRSRSSRSSNPQIGIYCIMHGDVEVYVGGSQDIANRCTHHRYMLRRGWHKCRRLQALWDEFGEDAFKFMVIETCEIGQIDDREEHWLRHYDETILNESRKANGSAPRKREV